MAFNASSLAVEGGKTVQRLLDELPRRVVKKGLRRAMTAAAAPMVKSAKRWAATESKTLKKSITRKIKTYSNGNVIAVIGARKDAEGTYRGRRRVPANYIHLVEKGTRTHRVRGYTHPGAKAQPFMGPAYQQNKNQAQQIAGQKLAESVISEATKLGKGG